MHVEHFAEPTGNTTHYVNIMKLRWAILFLGAVGVRGALAQPATDLSTVLRSLSDQTICRVCAEADTLEGNITVENDIIMVRTKSTAQSVSICQVQCVFEKRTSPSWRAVVIGGVLGAFVGGLWGAYGDPLYIGYKPRDSNTRNTGTILMDALFVAIVGSAVGASDHFRKVGWVRLFP